MKNKNAKNDNGDIIKFLTKNNLNLSNKTMGVLFESLQDLGLDAMYYDIFKLNSKIVNFFLKNSILWNETAFTTIMELASEYDENTVLGYMQLGLYEPICFWEYLRDNRIPKLDKTNYYKLISKQKSYNDINLAYDALLLPIIRGDEFYLNQIKNLKDNNNRRVLTTEVNCLKEIVDTKKNEYEEKIAEKLKLLSKKNATIAKNFFAKLLYYNDFNSLKFFLNVTDLKSYIPLMEIVSQVKNIDEYQTARKFMIRIIAYIMQKSNIDSEFQLDCVLYDEQNIPVEINKNQNKLFKKGYLNLYNILENLNEEFTINQEKPLILAKNFNFDRK